MLVHLFGATSSPSTAAFALRHTVELFGKEYSPEAVNVVLHNFYVDDMLMSTDSVKDGIQLANEVKKMLSRAGFDLHKWSSNCEDILNEVDTNRNESSNHTVPYKTEHCVLGVQWFVDDDAFKITVAVKEKPFTKRGMLSILNSIFDPLGFIAPVMIQPRLWLRKVNEMDWDKEFSNEMKNKWEMWIQSLPKLDKVTVKCCINPLGREVKAYELHHFADGSNVAYGAVSYIRMIYPDGEATCAFLMGKGYIAHRKRTVPQLEMLAAVVAVKLDELLRKILTLTISRSYFWSHSTATLVSIYSTKKNFPVFMANRLAEIEETTSKADWKYVPTNVNPADDISKGLVIKSFVQRSK